MTGHPRRHPRRHPQRHRPAQRLHDGWDAALHLLDRQVVDDEGAMVGKVDDVELTERYDGTLEVTGLLLGPPALLPRVASGLHELWRLAQPQRAGRDTPGRIDIAHVDSLTSEVRLGSGRDGVVRPQGAPAAPDTLRRLGDLLGMPAEVDGRPVGRVMDARIERRDDRLVVAWLIVGRGRPGSLLGYDRVRTNGPLPLARLVTWLHRHSALVDIAQVDLVWVPGRAEAHGPVRPLRDAADHREDSP